MTRWCAAAVLACLLALTDSAAAAAVEASTTGQPQSFLFNPAPYKVTGYGRFKLSMTADQVKAEIAAEYPDSVAAMKDEVAPLDRTRALSITVPDLKPAGIPATISFVFGYASHKLIAVNVSWLADGNPSEEQRQRLVDAGSTLAADLVGYRWPPLGAVRGTVLPGQTLILFSGRDAGGAGVEIRLYGVALDIEPPKDASGKAGPPEHRPAPDGPARLRLSHVASVDKPDVYRIPPGAF